MKLYYPITVDLYNTYPLQKMTAQQNNTGRGALITLVANGLVMVPTTEAIRIFARRPDGNVSYLDCSITDDGKIQADFSDQMLSVDGTMSVELQMTTEDTNITTPIFMVEVQKSNIKDAIESANEYKALEKYVDEAKQAAEQAVSAANDASNIKPLYAEYGVTSYEDIKVAYDSGRSIYAQMEVSDGEDDIPGIYSSDTDIVASWQDMLDIGDISEDGSGLAYCISLRYSDYQIVKIVLPQGITKIVDGLFSDPANWVFSSLKTIIIPGSVTEIGEYAFGEDCCGSLNELAIPSSVTTIHPYAFAWIPETIYYDGEIGDWLQGELTTRVQPYADAPTNIKVKERYTVVASLRAVKSALFEFVCMPDDLTISKLVCGSSGWKSAVLGTITATKVTCSQCGNEVLSTDGYTDKYGNHLCGECLSNYSCGMCGQPLQQVVDDGLPINDTNSMGWCCEACYDDLGDS